MWKFKILFSYCIFFLFISYFYAKMNYFLRFFVVFCKYIFIKMHQLWEYP